MAKETMLTYLETQLEKQLDGYDFAIEWNKRNHTIEVLVRLFAENNEQLAIDDAAGVVSEEEVIEFVDGVLLYDEQKARFDADDYMATLPFSGKKGMPQAQLDALAIYLKEVVEEGQSDLLDFLDPESNSETFELVFDQETYAALVAQQKGQAMIAYPNY